MMFLKIVTVIFSIVLSFSGSLYATERVAGTKVSLTAPVGFTKTTQFPGYMMESTGSSIMVSEIPAPFIEVSKGFSKKGLATQGMTLIEKTNVKIATGNAILIHVSQSAGGIEYLKWMLTLGNKDTSILVVATFPKQFKNELSNKLKQAVLSTEWDINAKVDFYEGLTFRIKEKGDLNIANKIGNNIFLTRNGAFPQKSPKDPLVVVGSSITQSWRVPSNKKTFARNRLLQTEILSNHKIISEENIKIDGLNGYLIEAKAADKSTGEMLYVIQCLLFTSDGYYIFQGFVGIKDKKKYNPIFIYILNSFNRT